MKKSGYCVGPGLGWLTDCGCLLLGSCHADEHCSSVYLFDCRLVDLCLG